MWVCQRKSSHSQNRSELHLILLSSCSSRVLQCFRDLFAATFQKFWVKVYYELTVITLPVVNKVYLYPMQKIEETFVFISYAENRGDIHSFSSIGQWASGGWSQRRCQNFMHFAKAWLFLLFVGYFWSSHFCMLKKETLTKQTGSEVLA